MTDEPDWIPPVDPDPTEIGQEAHRDQREGRYAVALAKRLWYHRHAVELRPGLRAVRLSFGIGYWHDLAKVYPPAMEAMKAERDAAEAKLRNGPADFATFSEFVAFNRRLGENGLTVQLFEWMYAADPEGAKRLYVAAEALLVAAQRYDLCGVYLDPAKRLEFETLAYHSGRDLEQTRVESGTGLRAPLSARRRYVHNVATMLALLSHNSRWEEAERYAEEAIKVLDDPESARAIFGKAVYGEFPPDR